MTADRRREQRDHRGDRRAATAHSLHPTPPLRLAARVLAPVLAIAGVPLVAGPAQAAGASLYVDRTVTACSDSGAGTTTTPFCTITKAVAALQPGGTVYIGNGTYAETVKPAVSGTSTAPVTVTRWPGRSPKIGGGVGNGVNVTSRSYVTISDLTIVDTIGDGIYVSGSNHVTISGNTVSGAGSPLQGATAQGISIRGTSASTVAGNTTDHNSGHGILLTSGSTGITVSRNEASFNAEGWRRNANGIDVISPGNTLIRNITHDNEDSGINIYPGGNNTLVTLNVTYNNGDHGIDDLNVTGGRLIGNTVYRNCTSGINVEGTSGSYTVVDNVAVDNAVYPAYNGISCSRRSGNIGIFDSAPSSTTVDHNLVFLTKPGTMYTFGSGYSSLAAMKAATGQEDHGVQADPRFRSASAADFRLSAGSPAIDRGDSGVSGEQSTDVLGNPRVDDPTIANTQAEGPRLYDDLGAYEFQPSGTPPPGNTAPAARLTVSPTSGTAPFQVSADASASTDPEGQPLSYSFAFGDGSTVGPQPGATASHTYTTAGSYQLTVTVTDTGGLSGTATATVTVGTAPPTGQPPTARLTVTPTSGPAPLQVTADASASTDPTGETLTYSFAFGDGSTVGPQPGATATHTFASAGSYPVQVTVTDPGGLTSSATQTVTVGSGSTQTPAAYVSQIATNYSTSTKTTGSITVWRSAGVRAGDLVVLTLQLGSTASSGTVTGTDTAGNTYTTVSSVADTSGNRLVVLSGVATSALAANDKVTVTFPTATGYRLIGDEFSGVTSAGTTAGSTGPAGTFGSGAVTASAGQLVLGTVLVAPGTGAPTWAAGWRSLGAYAVGSSYVSRAYQLPTASSSIAAAGTASGPWLATVATFLP